MAIILVVFAVYVTSNNSKQNISDPNSVAIVNGEYLPREEYDARVAQLTAFGGESENAEGYSEQALTQMISEKLLMQDANAKGYVVADEEVATEFDGVKQSFENEEKFNEALASQNMTSDQLKANIYSQLILEQYVEGVLKDKNVEVSEEEILSFYEQSVSGSEEAPSLEEVKEQVKQQLEQQKISAIMQEVIFELRDKADITILI